MECGFKKICRSKKYSEGISCVDPIKYQKRFSKFVNKEVLKNACQNETFI